MQPPPDPGRRLKRAGAERRRATRFAGARPDRSAAILRRQFQFQCAEVIRDRTTRIRRALFARGYRYRLHDRKLPGCPDIVFPGRRTLMMVHGCFWHAHG
ncbi:hypothetical protein [uncultured Thiocystis sp.]|uniref:hypothetical protein n=1 Tax=uncultured Thiocystis sp. TaxID=1202134 RepID=UPI0034498E70